MMLFVDLLFTSFSYLPVKESEMQIEDFQQILFSQLNCKLPLED